MFYWENAIALHEMQGNRASSRGEGEVSWVFSTCGRHVGYKKKKLLVVTYWPDVSEKTNAHCLIENVDRALLIRREQCPEPLGCGFTFLVCAPL